MRRLLLCMFAVVCGSSSDAHLDLHIDSVGTINVDCCIQQSQSVAICDRDFLRYDSCVATLNVIDVFQTYDVLLLLDAFG